MSRLEQAGLTANQEKCEFNKQHIKFYGMEFSTNGIQLDDKKVKAIKESTKSSKRSRVKKFFGSGKLLFKIHT